MTLEGVANKWMTIGIHLLVASYTISKDMAALNKLFNTHICKKDAGIKSRSYKDITRSRGEKAHDKKYNPDNYK